MRSPISITLVALTVGCLPPGAIEPAQLAPPGHPLVEHAGALAGTEYRLNGRLTDRLPGLDCMGLVFRAFERSYGVRWRQHSTMPTRLVDQQTLGQPVAQLAGVPSDQVDFDLLTAGDILLVLRKKENPKEPALVSPQGTPLWVWHMGIYTGGPERGFLHADPYHGITHEVALDAYLANFWLDNWGIFVVRPNHPTARATKTP